MRLLCDCKKFIDSIGNGEDREKFLKRFGSPERWQNGIFVNIAEHKTRTQLGAIWRDFTLVGNLLYTTAESVYIGLIRADEFLTFFTEPTERGGYKFVTLGSFDKDKTSRFIEAYRPYWQEKVNDAYGEYVLIDWSKREVSDERD
jgi:hypothetical protein